MIIREVFLDHRDDSSAEVGWWKTWTLEKRGPGVGGAKLLNMSLTDGFRADVIYTYIYVLNILYYMIYIYIYDIDHIYIYISSYLSKYIIWYIPILGSWLQILLSWVKLMGNPHHWDGHLKSSGRALRHGRYVKSHEEFGKPMDPKMLSKEAKVAGVISFRDPIMGQECDYLSYLVRVP